MTLHAGMQFSNHPATFLFGTQQQLTHPLVKSSNSPLWKNHVFLGLMFYFNVLTLSCLGSFSFGTLPYYSLNPYVHLYYLWSISIAKNQRHPKYFILCVVYLYSEKLRLSREVLAK